MRTLLFILLFPFFCLAQSDSSLIKEIHVAEGDTFISTKIESIDILSFKTKEDKQYYHQLKYKTLKVYPYALLAAHKLDSIEADLAQIPKRRKRKKYIKAVDRWIKEDLGEELKKLTRWEGRILVKLIHRETGISPYYILKDYRGNWQAFFWQQFAKLYENDLKSQYLPESVKEDRLIEHILLEAERNNGSYFPKRR